MRNAPTVHDVEHGVVACDPARFIAHPRHGVFRYWPAENELVVGYPSAPCAYYLTLPGDNALGGVRHVASTHFRL